MSGYRVILDKQVVKDFEELKRQGHESKVTSISHQLETNPFEPLCEKLCGEYRRYYSQRVNRTDRIVYEIREGVFEDGKGAVVISRMRAHYSGMFSSMML